MKNIAKFFLGFLRSILWEIAFIFLFYVASPVTVVLIYVCNKWVVAGIVVGIPALIILIKYRKDNESNWSTYTGVFASFLLGMWLFINSTAFLIWIITK